MASSASVERTVQILDFLTTHPGRGFTVSELSRRLQMSKATAHRILGSLTDHALVTRNPDTQEYRLGLALVPMGAVAGRSIPALAHATREAAHLAEQHDGECVLVTAIADEMLIVGHVGVRGPSSFALAEGQRQLLAPPMGAALIAWMSDHAVGAWLDRMEPTPSASERRDYRASIEAVRQRGYAVALRLHRLYELHELYTDGNLYTPEGRRKISDLFAALAHDDNYLLGTDEMPPDAEIGSISAPIFDPNGIVLFAIALIPRASHVRDLPHLSRAVVLAAERVTAAIAGRPPSAHGRARATMP